MKINEIFESIQGEGVLAGEPMLFIRCQGCNLRCKWCDTGYAQAPEDAVLDASISLLSTHIGSGPQWVCITGGEPLLQEGLVDLVIEAKSMDRHVEIETNGSIYPPPWAFLEIIDGNYRIPLVESWVIDIKLSSSGNDSIPSIITAWAEKARETDQIKMVIADDNDYVDAAAWMDSQVLVGTKATILLSPMIGDPDFDSIEMAREIAALAIRRRVRFSLQLHKILWGNKRGV